MTMYDSILRGIFPQIGGDKATASAPTAALPSADQQVPQSSPPAPFDINKMLADPDVARALLAFGSRAVQARDAGMSFGAGFGNAAEYGMNVLDTERRKRIDARKEKLREELQLSKYRMGIERDRLAIEDIRAERAALEELAGGDAELEALGRFDKNALIRQKYPELATDHRSAPIQFADELAKARESGDIARVNDLLYGSKVVKLPQGMTYDPVSGKVTNAEGIEIALGDQTTAKADAQNISDLTYDPKIAGESQRRKDEAELENAEAIAAAKATGAEAPKRRKAQKARTRVTSTLTKIANNYKKLDEMKGVINPENRVGENIMAGIYSSDTGQAVANTMGTEAASIRNQILMSRPALINDIRQASEMGARGMDSEQELQFYLQLATNPQVDVPANIAAIQIINEAYGLDSEMGADPAKIAEVRKMYQESLKKDSPVYQKDGFKFRRKK